MTINTYKSRYKMKKMKKRKENINLHESITRYNPYVWPCVSPMPAHAPLTRKRKITQRSNLEDRLLTSGVVGRAIILRSKCPRSKLLGAEKRLHVASAKGAALSWLYCIISFTSHSWPTTMHHSCRLMKRTQRYTVFQK